MLHRQAACGLVAVVIGASARAEEIRVPEDFPTIQAAIDAASDDDDILVGPGVYAESIDFLGKPISVTSTDGPEVTTIRNDGQGYRVVFDDQEGSDSVLEGFTITEDGANEPALLIEFSGPTIRGCRFVANGSTSLYNGAAIQATASTAVIEQCDFDGNESDAHGGAVYLEASGGSFTDCRFTGNDAHNYGGAVYITNFSNTTFTNCTLEANTATRGGAVYMVSNSTPVMDGCEFIDNTADGHGGALFLAPNIQPTLVGCLFRGNAAPNGNGGVIYCDSPDAPVAIADCAFVANGGGVIRYGTVTLLRCTFDSNYGRSVLYDSEVDATDCAFTNNTTEQDGGAINTLSALTLLRCTFDGNTADRNGGAIRKQYSGADIQECTFTSNVAVLGSSVFLANAASGEISDCIFDGNTTGVSGGVYNFSSSPTIAGCLFKENWAAAFGGGVFNFLGSRPSVVDCDFQDNTSTTGAGMYSWDDGSHADVSGSLFCGNDPDDIGGDWTDNGGNEFLAECEGSDDCPADIDQNDEVDFDDILAILDGWGPVEECPPFIRADIDQDCEVGFNDLVVVLSEWGACP